MTSSLARILPVARIFLSSRRGYMTIPLMVMIFLSAPPLFPVKLDLSLHPVMMNNNEKRTEWDIDFIV
jgi:hypothetical protein